MNASPGNKRKGTFERHWQVTLACLETRVKMQTEDGLGLGVQDQEELLYMVQDILPCMVVADPRSVWWSKFSFEP